MSETSITITTPIPEGPEVELSPVARSVSALQVIDEDSHRAGLEMGKRLKRMKAFIVDLYADPKKKAHETHKAITTKERQYLEPIEKTVSLLNGKLDIYEKREKARAEEEARERQREANRIEQERQALEAVAAEEAGDHELAETIIQAPVERAVVLPEPKVAEVAGASSRAAWKHEVQSLEMLVAYVSAHPEHLGLLLPNDVALGGMARALKENMRIPGVRAYATVVRSYKDA